MLGLLVCVCVCGDCIRFARLVYLSQFSVYYFGSHLSAGRTRCQFWHPFFCVVVVVVVAHTFFCCVMDLPLTTMWAPPYDDGHGLEVPGLNRRALETTYLNNKPTHKKNGVSLSVSIKSAAI